MKTLYDSDFYAWTQQQAQLLQKGKWSDIDVVNLIEEIETLGRQERRELVNRLGLVLGHLLKWQYQPEKRGNRWLSTLREQRREVKGILADNPSLQPYLEDALRLSYEKGVDLAVRETNLPYETFPSVCPYSLTEILDPEFFPE